LARIQSSSKAVEEVDRTDFSFAFDPIAASDKALLSGSGSLEASVFDRTLTMIALDVAPYVRSIVAYDKRLMEDRIRRSNLLSEGGRPSKKMRSTRAAFSALEGGSRSSTRRENYFTTALNMHAVLATGGKWERAVDEQLNRDAERLRREGTPKET